MKRASRLGFAGIGWIGLHRLQAVAASGAAEIVAVADPVPGLLERAAQCAPGARACAALEDLLALELDGLVIATPSALHATQAVAALERGLAVFCQKPLGRSARETRAVVEAARHADRLLAVDLSYRFTRAMQAIRTLVAGGDLGRIYAAHLVFHNAYGPDKPWFYDRDLAGGGCLIDLGIHLVDLVLWTLNARIERVEGHVFAGGRRQVSPPAAVEDYAAATLELDTGAVAQIACSWRLPAGQDAVIEAAFYGTAGGAALRNVNGSFYDFVAERYTGTRRETLVTPPDEWGGRAIVAWARRLGRARSYDPGVERLVEVAEAIDTIYGQGEPAGDAARWHDPHPAYNAETTKVTGT